MAVTDNDLETLDAYLDDMLESAEVESLQARIAQDGEMLAALEQLRAERSLRKSLFASLDPDDAAVARLVGTVRHSIQRRKTYLRVMRPMKYVAAAAACILVGFIFGRGTPNSNAPVSSKPGVDVHAVSSYEVTLRDETGKVVAVQRFDSYAKAQEFAADLAQWQSRGQRIAGGHFVLTADRF